jgi:hypothetical protein
LINISRDTGYGPTCIFHITREHTGKDDLAKWPNIKSPPEDGYELPDPRAPAFSIIETDPREARKQNADISNERRRETLQECRFALLDGAARIETELCKDVLTAKPVGVYIPERELLMVATWMNERLQEILDSDYGLS